MNWLPQNGGRLRKQHNPIGSHQLTPLAGAGLFYTEETWQEKKFELYIECESEAVARRLNDGLIKELREVCADAYVNGFIGKWSIEESDPLKARQE